MNVHLLVIDPQRDFCQAQQAALYVSGAQEDMGRLTQMIQRIPTKINEIHVTLDSHQQVHIAHPIWWVNQKGEHPNPFTIITEDDVLNGVWKTSDPLRQNRSLYYVQALKANGKYSLCIWPPHCIIGTSGHTILKPLQKELDAWSMQNLKTIDYIMKGNNPWTEHYSAIAADVIDPEDEGTDINTGILNKLVNADMIAISGEALSHCVASTVRDLVKYADPKRMYLLEDTCSNVTGFEAQGGNFIADMKALGMNVCKSTEFLA